MWNQTSRWQRRARQLTGAVALAGALVAPCLLLLPSASSSVNPVRELGSLASNMLGSADRTLPLSIEGRPMTAADLDLRHVTVYAQAGDGAGTLVGKIVSIDGTLAVLLPPSYADACRESGCELLIASPTRKLESALELILAPEGVSGELGIARTRLYPVIQRTLLSRMDDKLDSTLAQLVDELPREHRQELGIVAGDLKRVLSKHSKDLIGKLADRSWRTVGIWGVTTGVARVTRGKVEGIVLGGTDRAKEILGISDRDDRPDRSGSEFLSDGQKEDLREAIEEELDGFWEEQGDDILAAAGDVLEVHSSTTLKGLKQSWITTLRERVLEESWDEARDEMLAEVSRYATEFANRRLLTAGTGARQRNQGPSLPLAYAIRSSTGITRDPLLVLQRVQPDSPTSQDTELGAQSNEVVQVLRYADSLTAREQHLPIVNGDQR